MAQLSLSPNDTTNILSYPSATLSTKFPHTRAQLSAIARQHKPTDNYDSDAENDDYNRVSSSLVNRVVLLLTDENEDELKRLLRSLYGMDESTVRRRRSRLTHTFIADVCKCSWSRMS